MRRRNDDGEEEGGGCFEVAMLRVVSAKMVIWMDMFFFGVSKWKNPVAPGGAWTRLTSSAV